MGGVAQVPIVAPVGMVHMPLQQSTSRLQASPTWIHQEAPSWHLPLLQSFEQQSALTEHVLPAVWQTGLSA